jgi:hypothetical protein
VFRASQYPVESLERELDQSDFAIAIAQPDDQTESREQTKPTPRDNVIFELGFFMGRIGRHRSLLLEPRGEEVKLPSDLTGITAIAYKNDPSNVADAMGPACNRVRDIINHKSVTYFGDIADMTRADYRERLNAITPADLREDWIGQIHLSAGIAGRKHHNIKVAILLFCIGTMIIGWTYVAWKAT